MQPFRLNVSSAIGTWGVEGTNEGVSTIYLPNQKGRASSGDAPECVREAARQLEEFFEGTRTTFQLTLHHAASTAFQASVWKALGDIPFGEVRTYAEVARAVNRPKAARAVGNANHANPWPIIVPCHRVVASTGLGGYGGGEDVKRFLLALEGVTYD